MTTQIIDLSHVRCRSDITASLVREILNYNEESGVFTWIARVSKRIPEGSVAGSVKEGRVIIKINCIPIRAHRLAWLYVTGAWPEFEIDHKDTDALNNRFSNLRDVGRSENQQNLRRALKTNTSGHLGVSQKPWGYMARIYANEKQIYLGTFRTPEDAHRVYVEAKRKLHRGNTL